MPGTIDFICAQDSGAQLPYIQQTAGLCDKIQLFRSRPWHYESWNPGFLIFSPHCAALHFCVGCVWLHSAVKQPCHFIPCISFPCCVDAPWICTLIPTSRQPLDLYPAFHTQAVPGSVCSSDQKCWAADRNKAVVLVCLQGNSWQQQPGSSAFLHWVGGLVSPSAGTHPALRPQPRSTTSCRSSHPPPPRGSWII